jgi:hypothetical protein
MGCKVLIVVRRRGYRSGHAPARLALIAQSSHVDDSPNRQHVYRRIAQHPEIE